MIVFFVVIIFISVALAAVRFVSGPTYADRIIALDILFAAAISLCIAAALYTQRVLFIDIAIGVALVGFISTLAWARLVELKRESDTKKESEP